MSSKGARRLGLAREPSDNRKRMARGAPRNFTLRLAPCDEALIEQAAALRGLSKAAWIFEAVYFHAERDAHRKISGS